MIIIEPNVEIIEQEPGLNGILKQIELAGRTCYKSEDLITNDSAEKFVNRMIKSNHGSMLEHGTLYLDLTLGSPIADKDYMYKTSIIQIFKKNPYSVVNKYTKTIDIEGTTVNMEHYAITTNYRVFIEQIDWEKLGPMRRDKIHGFELGLDKDFVLSFMCEPTEYHEKRVTVRFSTDRGVSAEANRHRTASPGEQSTRYCDYSKEKFDKQVGISSNADLSKQMITDALAEIEVDGQILLPLCEDIVENKNNEWDIIRYWIFANSACEFSYMNLLKLGWKAEQARRVLPLDLHTELVHTAFVKDWKHFLDLRSKGTTGKPHPDMKLVADPLYELFIQKHII